MILIVMGVSGSGKSTIGALLAEALGATFAEGDRYHPPANVRKMASGTPLADADRWPWLAAIAAAIVGWRADGRDAVVTCSALKEAYRARLADGARDVRFVFLKGSEALIRDRLRHRSGHFMPPTLLASQFAALEEPREAIAVDIAPSPREIVAVILAELAR